MIKADARTYWLIALLATVVCTPLHAADTQVHVIPDSQLENWWRVPPGTSNPHPEWHASTVNGCVAVAFEIHGDGSVSNQRVWRSAWTDAHLGRQFEKAVLLVLPRWRFVPAATNVRRDPVYTYEVFLHTATFINRDNPAHHINRRIKQLTDEIQAKCEMTDFPQQVQTMIGARKPIQKP